MAPQFHIARFKVYGLKVLSRSYPLSLKINFKRCCRSLGSYFFFFSVVSYGQVDSLPDELAGGVRIPNVEVGECPSLSLYYQKALAFDEPETVVESWAALAAELINFMPGCLRSSEYFALLGAAQLNSAEIFKSIESLERSLLLNPEGRGAMVDYARALHSVGQLFPALEINEALLADGGFPQGLQKELKDRNKLWRSETRQNSFSMDIGGGYDTNLNGASNVNEIYLTLSGEEVALSLDGAFESTNGAYSNLRLGNQRRLLAPDHQHTWSNEIRSRLSEDHRSDMLRLDSRYSFVKASRSRNWRFDGGLTHLLFGGSSLYSAAQLSGRYQFRATGACSPAMEVVGQRQYFRQQLVLNGVEGKIAGRVQCDLKGSGGRLSSVSVEAGALRNYSIRSARPGGNREGWQTSLQWQTGKFLAQASYTHLDDRLGYSPILKGGAKRWINRSQVVLQFRQPTRFNKLPGSWFVNFFHQNQESNINLFAARDTSIEFGFGFVF